MRDYEPYYTEDGSIGLYSHAQKDVFHSKFGALTEAWEKFVIPAKLDELMETRTEINVLDICYGIGYNTKALMSYILNKNYKKLKTKNFFQKIKIFVSICINNVRKLMHKLLPHIVAIHNDKYSEETLPKISIDCLDINEELLKLSPLFRRIKTPAEIFYDIVPDIFDCFETYYKLRDIFVNIASHFSPKNKRDIKALLELRFKNMHIEREYRINPLVNYMLINKFSEIFGSEYIDENIKNILREKWTRRFFAKSLIKYAKFNQFWGYNKTSKWSLSTFLHNIYYHHLSIRNNYINFKRAESLFNINFYINDARKSIKQIPKLYDCIFLDAFTYTKAPQLWSVEFVAELAKRLKDDGVILTYSNSAQIRNTFLENNLFVGKIYNSKNKNFNGTIASKNRDKIDNPLNNYEIGLCNTKAGIPYHDPNLAFDNKDIIELREYEFRHSELMSSSKYMKLRSLKDDNE